MKTEQGLPEPAICARFGALKKLLFATVVVLGMSMTGCAGRNEAAFQRGFSVGGFGGGVTR